MIGSGIGNRYRAKFWYRYILIEYFPVVEPFKTSLPKQLPLRFSRHSGLAVLNRTGRFYFTGTT